MRIQFLVYLTLFAQILAFWLGKFEVTYQSFKETA
jgi:hypothetical protein